MIETNQKQEVEFAAFLGIGWADQKHAWGKCCNFRVGYLVG